MSVFVCGCRYVSHNVLVCPSCYGTIIMVIYFFHSIHTLSIPWLYPFRSPGRVDAETIFFGRENKKCKRLHGMDMVWIRYRRKQVGAGCMYLQ